MSRPFLVVHAHCYQPPRENPWTEEVEAEPSAAPFHDWNLRIAAESYRPNAFARILGDGGEVVAIVNNFERLSFNVGATLSSWLERHDRRTYDRMRAAHAETGGAIAQPFVHLILPLASALHCRTAVRWGVADFRHRFGTEPVGMWLPETAVNDEVLGVLAEEGLGFTVLAPTQALRVRPLGGGDDDWREVGGGSIDPTVPYRWCHPDGSGRGVDLVFYDGPLSAALAFRSLSSEEMVGLAAAAPGASRLGREGTAGGLVCAALDGETFGHHQRFGDRALAYALAVEAPRRGFEVGSLARYLRRRCPSQQVEVGESAWSCTHGVGRWERDCGCSTGAPGFHQRWRAPLRAALDLVRQAVDDSFARRAPGVFHDPWRALDEYVDVLVGAVDRESFSSRHVSGDDVEALTLLETQRHAMLMYTSCGWFFADLAGLESIQVLRYAARALDLLVELGEEPPVEAILDTLDAATSNDPAVGDGRRLWRAEVDPARVDAERVAAHLALEGLSDRTTGAVGTRGSLGGFVVEVLAAERAGRAGAALYLADVRLTHRRTGRVSELLAAAFRVSDQQASDQRATERIAGAVRPKPEGPNREGLGVLTPLRAVFDAGGGLDDLRASLVATLGARGFGLTAALPGSDLAGIPQLRQPAPGTLRVAPGANGTLVEERAIGEAALLAVRQALLLRSPEAVDRARARVADAERHRADEALECAQSLVYEALLVGADPRLRPLASDLGLAADLASAACAVADASVAAERAGDEDR